MKKLILLMLASAPAVLFAQGKFTIKGNIGKVDAPAKIFLQYESGAARTAVTDSTTMTKGAFKFQGVVDDITHAVLILDYKGVGLQNAYASSHPKLGWLQVYLANGTTVISSPDSLPDAKISGTKVNEDFQRYEAFTKPVKDSIEARNKNMEELQARIKEKKDTAGLVNDIDKMSDRIDTLSKNLDKQFIAANPDSYISLVRLRSIVGPYPDVNVLEPLFDRLSPSLRATAAGATYQKYINSLKTIMIGATAPDFAEPDTSGKMVSLSSFRGKYLLLDFWASWCAPCRRENPNVVKAYNKYKDKDFTILSVSLDMPGKKDAWLNAIHHDHLPWNHVSSLKYWNDEAVILYGIKAVPQNVLIDPSGKIIARNLYGDDLQNKLAELLK